MRKRKLALVLSGGGSRGAYQCGVWQALSELGIKPDIVVGVSVGAINGAMVLQEDVIKTANLWRKMETDMIFDVSSDAQVQDFAKEFVINRGAGSTGLQNMLKEYIDEDFIRNSKTDFGLLTVQFPSMKPYYLWKEDIPYGKLCDYITASASAFPAIHTHEIDGKEFIDGGYENNLPLSMAMEKGATEIIAVYLDAVGRFHPEEVNAAENLTMIQSPWDLGDFLVFEKKNAKRILRIGYLDAMKTFDIFEGKYYTFVKGDFDKKSLTTADQAAKIFELDPLILYRKEIFMEKLKEAVKTAKNEVGETLDDLSSSLTAIRDLDKIVNRKTVLIVIAHNLKDRGKESIFASRYASRFFKEEIAIAKFLIKNSLI